MGEEFSTIASNVTDENGIAIFRIVEANSGTYEYRIVLDETRLYCSSTSSVFQADVHLAFWKIIVLLIVAVVAITLIMLLVIIKRRRKAPPLPPPPPPPPPEKPSAKEREVKEEPSPRIEKKFGKEAEKIKKSEREEFTEIFEVFQPEEE